MMGAMVAHIREVGQERTKELFVHVVSIRNGLTISTVLQVGNPARKLAQAHDLAHGPNGRQCRIIVGSLVMFDEFFFAASEFFDDFTQSGDVPVDIIENE